MKKVITIEAVKGKQVEFFLFHKIEDAERKIKALEKEIDSNGDKWKVRYLQK